MTPTMSPVNIPLGATLRPTTYTTTMAPTMYTQIETNETSGEPLRIINVLSNIALSICLTIVGIFIIIKDKKLSPVEKNELW